MLASYKNKILLFRDKLIKIIHTHINNKNRKKLKNWNPTIICSDCTGGIISNWLGIKFNSPFINLYMNNTDFITALENFDEFIEGEIIEDKLTDKPFPVGIGIHGERIYFMHYPDFETALNKWNERKKRINFNNIRILFTNLGEGIKDLKEKNQIIKRFDQLAFKHKLIITGEKINSPFAIHIKAFDPSIHKIYSYNKWGKRFLDQFDYISFFN